MTLQNLSFRSRALIIGLLAVVIVYILWNVPQLGFVAYPFRLFVTYIHESGHSIMTLLTGGQVVGFTVSANGAGLATRAEGSDLLVIPAGYLGAAFFGALLFYLIHRTQRSRTISVILGLWLIGFSVAFARPDETGLPIALFVGILSGLALIGVGWKLSREINLLVLNVLAMMTALNAVFDLVFLMQHADATNGEFMNDAANFAQTVRFLPASVWAFIWAILAVLMLGLSVYWSVIRPLLRRQ